MREHGWALFLGALASFLLLPATPVLQVLAPVGQPMILIIPALAACAVVGWAVGGRLWIAVAWTALAIWVLFTSPGVAGESRGYVLLERGWSLVLAGAFGLVTLISAFEVRFFSRALLALAAAVTFAGGAFLVAGAPAAAVRRTIEGEIARRSVLADSNFQRVLVTDKALFDSDTVQEAELEAAGRELFVASPAEQGPRFLVALLALESLCALALAWALYHRIARSRIGLPLAKLRDFRFNDQLVWGVIIGVIFLAAPFLRGWRGVGANLTLYFGTLYAIRGTGVLAWFMRSARLGVVTLIAVALLAGLLAPALALGLSLIGLGDTWEDWRAKARPTTGTT